MFSFELLINLRWGEGVARDPGIREDAGDYLLVLGSSGHLKASMVCLDRLLKDCPWGEKREGP